MAVDVDQLPTQKPKEKEDDEPTKETTSRAVFYDPLPLFKSIMSSPLIMQQVHVGFAHFVDAPMELWESNSWATSIRAASGDHASYPDGAPLFPSDFVRYMCNNIPCACHCNTPHFGRVHSVGRDLTTASRHHGQVVVKIQRLVTTSSIPVGLERAVEALLRPLDAEEVILVEDDIQTVLESDIIELSWR